MKFPRSFLLPILALVFLHFPLIAQAGEKDDPDPSSVVSTNTPSNHAGLGTGLIKFFQKHISPVDGDRCPSLPTCSEYGLQAFKKHGFVLGWMITVDRLIHEGLEETKVSPLIFYNGQYRIHDPVVNNDFWWYP